MSSRFYNQYREALLQVLQFEDEGLGDCHEAGLLRDQMDIWYRYLTDEEVTEMNDLGFTGQRTPLLQ